MIALRAQVVYVAGHEYRRDLGWRCARCGGVRVLGRLRPRQCRGLPMRLCRLIADAFLRGVS